MSGSDFSYEFIDRRNTDSLKHDFAIEKGLPESVMPLWVADMDFRAPASVINAVKERAEHGIYGYCDTKQDYYKAVAGWFRERFGWETEEKWMVKTPGVVFALATAVRATTQKGDAVIIQPPVYYPFFDVIRNNDRKIIESPLVYKDGVYSIDFEDFEKKIVENSVKLFILCSPHNPVCRVWTKDELSRLGEICLKHGVYVVSDEIHCDFVFEGKHTVFTEAVPSMKDRTIICTAPSKTFNLAGLQTSNIFIPGESLREKFQKEIAVTGYTVMSNFGILACKTAYETGAPWLSDCLEYIRGNYLFVRDYLRENLPEIKLVCAEGTYFAWLDCSALGLTHSELDELIINKAGLWLDSGTIFGTGGEQFQRIVLACPRDVLKEAMERLYKAVKEVK